VLIVRADVGELLVSRVRRRASGRKGARDEAGVRVLSGSTYMGGRENWCN